MSHVQAVLLVLCGATAMSFVGLLLRLIDAADGFQILFYRSLSLALMVGVVACLRRRCGPAVFLASLDRMDLLVGLFLSVAFSTYVFAILNTNVASALFILSSAPIFAALLGWIILDERPSGLTVIALCLAVAGVAVMVHDGVGSGATAGNLFALLSAFCFACMLVTVRRNRKEDALGGTFIGGILASAINAVVALAIGSGLLISGWDLGLSLFMGAFTIGIGIALVTWAAGHLPASEVGILVLLESVLGPVWVWMFLGETTTLQVLVGGAIVLGAVVLQASNSARRPRVISNG